MVSSLAGRLLVATPRIGDPNFERTVVLVLAHGDEEGTFGVVINRPSETPLVDLVPAWADAAAAPAVMFLGGPVAPSAVVGVGVMNAPGSLGVPEAAPGSSEQVVSSLVDGWRPIQGVVGTVDLNRAPEELTVPLRGVRLFAGSAGWSAAQLDSELTEQAWWVLDTEPADLLTDDPGRLWRAVLRRQEGSTAWFATFPVDPLVN